MGRPRKNSDGIVLSANGTSVAWEPGIGFRGDPELVEKATTAAEYGFDVAVHPHLPTLTADSDTALGAWAAMHWATGGRSVIVRAPQDIPHFLGYDADSEPTERDLVNDVLTTYSPTTR